MRVYLMILLMCGLSFGFDLIEMSAPKQTQPKVLIIGGIQGDEPGGFNAINLFLQHYQILEGAVLAIPNLNHFSIMRNHRGIYGDMNRKFSTLSPKDEEYQIVERVKNIIVRDDVDFVFHLHDGSGFYRKEYIDKEFNPNKWGNCSIIDQEVVDGIKYGDLLKVSNAVVANINQGLLKAEHRYHIHNTHTAKGDREMEKALTYFAVRHNKPAVANEASKNLPVKERVYYHLLAIEGMLQAIGVRYQRDFDLTPNAIDRLINDRKSWVKITPLIELPLFDLQKNLTFFPFPSGVKPDGLKLDSNQYITGLVSKEKNIVLKYGNRVMTTLTPLYLKFATEVSQFEFEIDGVKQQVKAGSIVKARKFFKVEEDSLRAQQRVNIIGYQGVRRNEAGERVGLNKLIKRYAIDKQGKKYRVEFYEGDVFLGMVVVDFGL
ncbi:hypothetical protein BBW65_06375 [Helicobacter enhydrae]|uniref:Purine-nucleoside phosphorylase n=1 Tax=Helicobacter enhydrae TaxID=222136 RepID=A0A1B1U6M4_9HELI|nr:M99 family carboxypeptidase catalytic domain-containing protein [Helicobacter enhydrae]ANV98443.1 hypothetical protein BBW65_06375 [Helicobacter enhydrae]